MKQRAAHGGRLRAQRDRGSRRGEGAADGGDGRALRRGRRGVRGGGDGVALLEDRGVAVVVVDARGLLCVMG